MSFWQEIQQSFRGSMEGAAFAFFLLVLLGIGLPILYQLFAEQFRQRSRMRLLRRRMSREGLDDLDWQWVQRAVNETCPENPERILDSQSMFHTWIDGLEDMQDPDPELVKTLERIRDFIYVEGSGAVMPHSSRDLIPGASVNIVAKTGFQEVIPGIIAEVGLDLLRIGKRGVPIPSIPAGSELSLFYPRPEAMYHAVCRVIESRPAELKLAHAQKGHFNVRQLREFWRVDVDIPVEYKLHSLAGDVVPTTPLAPRRGRIINLSGSGAAIATDKASPRGSTITFPLRVQVKVISLQAEVLHVTTNRERSRLHLVFRNLDPGDQDLIIRSLFARYREQALEQPGFDALP